MIMALEVALVRGRVVVVNLKHQASQELLQRILPHLCPWTYVQPKMRVVTVAHSSVDQCTSSAGMPI